MIKIKLPQEIKKATTEAPIKFLVELETLTIMYVDWFSLFQTIQTACTFVPTTDREIHPVAVYWKINATFTSVRSVYCNIFGYYSFLLSHSSTSVGQY